MLREQVILWHAQAPSKPALGAPCNGCGLCCLAEPCPIGMLLSRRRHGACNALRWNDAAQNYRCGVLEDARAMSEQKNFWQRSWGRLWLRFARRSIAADTACDADLQIDHRE